MTTGVKVFSATKARERSGLGERMTEWLRAVPAKDIRDVQVTQSSDEEFHCLTISILYEETSPD
ncbi:MAG: hypothetical protein JRF33_14760 [Deltaproteobacteria bacterium]|nr:hypothetical protein [Deltaproteobacteria bacterium]